MTEPTEAAGANRATRARDPSILPMVAEILVKWARFLIKGTKGHGGNRTEQFWDLISQDFDRQAKSERMARGYARMLARTKPYLEANHVVLDCGCATGTLAIDIASSVQKVRGIDISSQMIAAAQRKAAERGIENVEFVHTSVFDPQNAPGSFDVVLAMNVLHLLQDPQKAVARMHDLLKPGGVFISATECMGQRSLAPLNLLLRSLMALRLIPRMRFFTTAELEGLIASEHFRIKETDSHCTVSAQPNHLVVAVKG